MKNVNLNNRYCFILFLSQLQQKVKTIWIGHTISGAAFLPVFYFSSINTSTTYFKVIPILNISTDGIMG